jgi:hypothetical protein
MTMAKAFEGFDHSNFWEDSDYAHRQYVSDPLSAELVPSVEEELGFKLPASYLELMKNQNGGIPRNHCFPTNKPTSWAKDHVAISGIFGVGRDKPYSLLGNLGSKFMQEQWGYPDIGICICDCPSAGHDMIMLDYRKCGSAGEPEVVHVDQESDFKITFLAKSFESFIRGLVNESVYDTSAEDLKIKLKKIETGSFSTLLARLISSSGEPQLGTMIRNLCRTLTIKKGYFALHADDLSLLVYDALFFLYTKSTNLKSKDAYLKVYPDMIALGDGDFSTGGYAPDFIQKWFAGRISQGQIVTSPAGSLVCTDDFRQAIKDKLREYE